MHFSVSCIVFKITTINWPWYLEKEEKNVSVWLLVCSSEVGVSFHYAHVPVKTDTRQKIKGNRSCTHVLTWWKHWGTLKTLTIEYTIVSSLLHVVCLSMFLALCSKSLQSTDLGIQKKHTTVLVFGCLSAPQRWVYRFTMHLCHNFYLHYSMLNIQ